MARRFFAAVQDASIYRQFPTRNTGFDEILEVGVGAPFPSASFTTTGSLSSSVFAAAAVRALIQFDMTDVLFGISNGDIPPDAQFFLNLRIANASEFQRGQQLEFWSLAPTESWDEGTGYFYQDLTNAQDGVTWLLRNSTNIPWAIAGGTTGSFIGSVTFGWNPSDVRFDLTEFIATASFGWISGSNNGVLIKLPASDEANSRVRSNIKFFSRNTHTVYLPTLEVVWYDQVINTNCGCGLTPVGDEFELILPDARKEYVTGSTNRIRLNARPLQPVKRFIDRFRTANEQFLQSGSMYSIVDDANKDVVIPFDSGSMISADCTGSYFDLKIENLYVNRTYRILVQVPKSWGSEVIDTAHRFRVI